MVDCLPANQGYFGISQCVRAVGLNEVKRIGRVIGRMFFLVPPCCEGTKPALAVGLIAATRLKLNYHGARGN